MSEQISNDELSVDIDDDGTIVVHGDIDIAGGPIVEAAVLRDGQALPMVIDLGDVFFIDSSGLRSLLTASRKAQAAGSHVELRSVGPEVLRLLQITGTTGQFELTHPRD
jgi:anti-anti-sigma factor